MSEKRSPERIAACKAACKKLYQERKEWGVCVICGKPRRNGETTRICKFCTEARNKYREKKREHIRQQQRDRISKFRAAGLCIYCGKPPVPGSSRCEYHAEYYKEASRRWAEKQRKRLQEDAECNATNDTNA